MSDKSNPRAYADPNHPGNGPRYHTGKPCCVEGCAEPAGTWWGPYWCCRHNVERIERIDRKLQEMSASFAERGSE